MNARWMYVEQWYSRLPTNSYEKEIFLCSNTFWSIQGVGKWELDKNIEKSEKFMWSCPRWKDLPSVDEAGLLLHPQHVPGAASQPCTFVPNCPVRKRSTGRSFQPYAYQAPSWKDDFAAAIAWCGRLCRRDTSNSMLRLQPWHWTPYGSAKYSS